jgi:thymidylate kinase
LDEYFSLLGKVEAELQAKPQKEPLVVVVVGLDGSGNSTLVETLATSLENAKACATPTTQLKDVRPVFDKRGGPVARAFYMVTNHILQHEIRIDEKHSIVVVDQWFSSACACSIAWKNATRGSESIDALLSQLFQWPHDLVPPQLMMMLDLDDEMRRQCFADRATAANFYPWDERLLNDALLGQRIMRAHKHKQWVPSHW